jgi:hypothetical protein
LTFSSLVRPSDPELFPFVQGERYLDCGNPRCGFARIRCPHCQAEHLLMFSCRTRRFCPSCHAKRLEEWGEWMRETLLLDIRKVYEVDPMICPRCGGQMKVIAFLTDYPVVEWPKLAVEHVATLMQGMPDRVGSPLSLNTLTEDIEASYTAVKNAVAAKQLICAVFLIPLIIRESPGRSKKKKRPTF